VSQSQLPSLQTIEFRRTDWTRWAGSVALHTFSLALVIAVPWAAREAPEPQPEHVALLVDPVIPAPRRAVRPVVVNRLRPPVISPVVSPVTVKPKIMFQAPKPQVLPARKVEIENAAPASVPAEVHQIAVAKIELSKPAPPVKVGGFGDPNGVQPSTNSSPGKLTAAKTGSFDLSGGNARRKWNGGNRGGVALAGFGDGTATAGTGPNSNGPVGNGHGVVRSTGFGEYNSAPAVMRAVAPATQPVETPVEITFKPKPAYTAEAREKKVEGEVLLEVIFTATGQIHIERVMRGLGSGLDERARDAAAQIRFQPGTRAGSPVDMKGIVHIVFALS
jgi:TonB family protein